MQNENAGSVEPQATRLFGETDEGASAPSNEFRAVVDAVMDVDDVTYGRPTKDRYSLRYRGRLRGDSAVAYDAVDAVFGRHNFTTLFRFDGDRHAILAVPGKINPRPSNPWINLGLFLATLASIAFTGYTLSVGDPNIPNPILTGVGFAAGMLGILLAHEFGHYFAARYHGAPVTLPYFLPLPVISPFGTLGAFIAMKAPIKNRRILLDIGISGPLAGLVVAIPVLLLGLSLSQITVIPAPLPDGSPVTMMEGNSLLYLAAKYMVFGQLLPSPESFGDASPLVYWLGYFFTGQPFPYGAVDVSIHPLAWAGWGGLLVTGLNLIPAGQFDGGHTIYVLLGDKTRYLTTAIVGILLLAGFVWSGWWLWAALIFFLNRQHAELLDEITPLDRPRWFWAVLTLVVALLVFTPVPIVIG